MKNPIKMDSIKVVLFLPYLVTCQQTCQVIQPTGWETGTDGSGLRASILESRAIGQNLTYKCPGTKVSERDSKSLYKAACVEESPGLAGMQYEFKFPWPSCQCPETVSCTMEGEEEKEGTRSTSATRYAFNIEEGDNPGVDLKIPVDTKLKVWEIIITWDILTLNDDIDITTTTKGVRLERMDFQGQQHRFSPFDATTNELSEDGTLHLDIGFNFRDSEVRADSKKWHYPCIERLECKSVKPPAEFTYLSLLIVVGSVSLIILACTCLCGAVTWCLKQDRAYGLRPVTALSTNTVKVRPYTGESQF